MPRRRALGLGFGTAVLLLAAIGASLFVRGERTPSAFELGSRLGSAWQERLEELCTATYGPGAVRAAVSVEIDAAERTLERDEIDPSTALAVERAEHRSAESSGPITRYEASRVREIVREVEPRLRRIRVVLIADPALAVPVGSAPRAPSEAERSSLAEELTALVHGVVPLGDAGESTASSVELILRSSAVAGASGASAAGTSLAVAWWPFLAGLALLIALFARELRRRNRRSAAAAASVAIPTGAERAREWAAKAPQRAARVLARWASREANASRRAGSESPQAAAIAIAELGPRLSAAVLSCFEPADAKRIALALDTRPASFSTVAIDALCGELSAELDARGSEHELDAAPFLDLCRGVLSPAACADIEGDISSAALRRERLAAIERLPPRELDLLFRGAPEADAASLAALLAPEVVARWLEILDAPERDAWIERIARVEHATPEACDAQLAIGAEAARRISRAREHRDASEMRAARVVARLPGELRVEALRRLEEVDSALSRRVSENLLGFEDLARLAPESLRALLGCLELGELALALHEAPDEIEAAVEEALTPRVRLRLRDERAQCTSATSERVRAAKARLVEALRGLFENGQIELPATASSEAGT